MTLNLYQQTNYPMSPQYIAEEAQRLREQFPALAKWAENRGVIKHQPATQIQVYLMAESLLQKGLIRQTQDFYERLEALDCLTQQAMWLVVHMTYANRVYLDGRNLEAKDFKTRPWGFTGGALNMVPAYAGLLAANHFTGFSRDWLIGQGHCGAAIDALQLLVGIANPERKKQYPLTEDGLSRFVADYGSTKIDADRKSVV